MAAPNALVIAQIFEAVIPAVQAAWNSGSVPSLANLTILEDSIPRTFQELPFCSMSWADVKQDFSGPNASVAAMNAHYRIDIYLFFAMPKALGTASNKLSRVKATYASALIAQLQTGATFAGVMNNHRVSMVSAKDIQPPFEGAAVLHMCFEGDAMAVFLTG